MNIHQSTEENVNYKKGETFMRVVWIAGRQYQITERNVYTHYRSAQKLLKDKDSIIGWQNEKKSTK
jgi:hypothetical protein